MNYKVGDIVKIRKDLIVDAEWDGLYIAKEMAGYFGTKQTIQGIVNEGYFLSGCENWLFNDAMIEGLADEPEPTRPEPSRLEIAAMAMQGMLACPNRDLRYDSIDKFISECYEYADALIKECNKAKGEDKQ